MKFTTALVALASTALAVPAERRDTCTFGTYACTADNSGIQICNIEGNWEVWDARSFLTFLITPFLAPLA